MQFLLFTIWIFYFYTAVIVWFLPLNVVMFFQISYYYITIMCKSNMDSDMEFNDIVNLCTIPTTEFSSRTFPTRIEQTDGSGAPQASARANSYPSRGRRLGPQGWLRGGSLPTGNSSLPTPPYQKAEWDDCLVEIFLDICICIDLAMVGHMPGSHLDSQGYVLLETKFKEKTGLTHTRAQLKNKFEKLRKDWQVWGVLSVQTGKGWNSLRQTWDGADDEWWQNMKMVSTCSHYYLLLFQTTSI